MKGVLFEVLREVVSEVWSEDEWDDILDEAGLRGAYTSLGTYPDTEVLAIVATASSRSGMEPAELLRTVGRLGFARLAARAPQIVERFGGWRDLVCSLDDVIHPEVAKLYPGAQAPEFEVVSQDPLRVRYRSARHLCPLAEGLVAGAAAWFGDDVSVQSASCIARGDSVCELVVP
jgi:predicted hydrocarbon binding protein